MRLNLQFGALATLVTLAGALAGTAYTRDEVRVVDYACPAGEHFRVEYLGKHVRLRTGAGVFALTQETTVSGAHFSDGQTVLRSDAREATLERPGLPPATGCTPRRAL